MVPARKPDVSDGSLVYESGVRTRTRCEVRFSGHIAVDLERLKGQQPTDRTSQTKAYSGDISIGESEGKHRDFENFTSATNFQEYLLKVRTGDFLAVGEV
jgi:hypothetical protein